LAAPTGWGALIAAPKTCPSIGDPSALPATAATRIVELNKRSVIESIANRLATEGPDDEADVK